MPSWVTLAPMFGFFTAAVAVGAAVYYYFQAEQADSYGYRNESYFDMPTNSGRNFSETYETPPSRKKKEENLHSRKKKKIGPDYCTICLDGTPRSSNDFRTLNCGHSFHENCISRWWTELQDAKVAKMCPNCRANLS